MMNARNRPRFGADPTGDSARPLRNPKVPLHTGGRLWAGLPNPVRTNEPIVRIWPDRDLRLESGCRARIGRGMGPDDVPGARPAAGGNEEIARTKVQGRATCTDRQETAPVVRARSRCCCGRLRVGSDGVGGDCLADRSDILGPFGQRVMHKGSHAAHRRPFVFCQGDILHKMVVEIAEDDSQ